MPKKLLTLFLLAAIAVSSCQKEINIEGFSAANPQRENSAVLSSKAILVDASKDGGVWWAPQKDVFSAAEPHQGKALVDYLKSLGFTVDEVPRGKTVTWDLLKKYSKVIRAVGFGQYTKEELDAYSLFLNQTSSLLLASDHLGNSSNDALNTKLGLHFSGVHHGEVLRFESHAITAGISPLSFMGGSVIEESISDKILPLGYLHSSNNDPKRKLAMGILKHPSSKIFFIGDLNGLEQVPQPFTQNLVQWLFQ